MARIIILGTAYSIPDQNHENTHMAVVAGRHTMLVDCPGSPIVRLRMAGIDPLDLTELVLTHFHPDHVSAVPLLLMDLWLLGRKTPLDVYGLQETLSRMKGVMQLYQWERWPGFFQVNFHELSDTEMAVAFESGDLRLFTSPVCHLIPTIGLRIVFLAEEKTVAYSCDTSPCPQVIQLATDADILIHEATGASQGHTSPAQAGEIASQAGAKSLYLIHYPVRGVDYVNWVNEAMATFSGPVTLAEDFMTIEV